MDTRWGRCGDKEKDEDEMRKPNEESVLAPRRYGDAFSLSWENECHRAKNPADRHQSAKRRAEEGIRLWHSESGREWQ